MDINLTPTEERYLKFLKAYQEGHGGLGPSYLEIMDAMEVTKATAQDYMERLRKKGAVKWPSRQLRKLMVLR